MTTAACFAMADFSNTEPEHPLAQVDTATAHRLWAELIPARKRFASPLSPALDVATRRPAAAEALYERLRRDGAPLIEPADDDDHRLVTFLHRAPENTSEVHVVGQIVHAPDARSHRMHRIPGTDLWGLAIRARRDLRTTYRVHASAISAPLWSDMMRESEPDRTNHRRFGDRAAEPSRLTDPKFEKSILELDRAPHAALGLDPGIDASWTRHWFRSELMDNTRRVWSWRPHDAPAGLLVLHSGWEWVHHTRVAAILSELTTTAALPPLLVLAVESLSGCAEIEMGCNDRYTDAVVTEIIPWARAHWSLPPGPERVILAGQSWGGLNAAYTALRHPQAAAGILSQSGSFQYGPGHDPDGCGSHGWLIERFRDSSVVPTRFHLQVGNLEGHHVTVTRHMRDVLIAKGYEVSSAETNDDHSWWSWQFSLVDGLIALTHDWQARS